MAADQQAPQTRAVQILEQGVEFNLDAFPEDRFNRLVPTQTLRMPSDLIVPVVQAVKLDLENDTYESRDIKKGHRAPSRVGLRKLATAAGVSIVDVQRTDDGSDPNLCAYKAVAEMTLPTGQRVRAVGTKSVNLDTQSWASSNQRQKYASFFAEHVASRAENRAIRSLLSLRSSYTIAELQKPFAVATFAPNMDHPEVRARILDAMAPTVQALYGPEDAKQLAAGDVVDAPEAPDDDETVEGETVAMDTNGHHEVDVATGEVIGDEPDWFGDTATVAADQDLVSRLQRVAQANKDHTGPASVEQRGQLREVLRGLNTAEAGAVIAHVWDIGNLAAIEGRHAIAILEVAAAMGHDALIAEWKALAAEVAS